MKLFWLPSFCPTQIPLEWPPLLSLQSRIQFSTMKIDNEGPSKLSVPENIIRAEIQMQNSKKTDFLF